MKTTITSLLLILASLYVHAAENIKFHGTLVDAPDCHINDDQPVTVLFGNVGVNKVDGNNYSRTIDYHITCDYGSTEQLYISVDGTGVDYNNAAVKASADNIAIEIRHDGEPFVLGTQIKVDDINNPPALTAVPVRDGDKALVADEFTASATLVAFYQ